MTIKSRKLSVLRKSKNFKWVDEGISHNLTVTSYICPSCNREIKGSPRESEAMLNCEHCEQKLDWSNPNEN